MSVRLKFQVFGVRQLECLLGWPRVPALTARVAEERMVNSVASTDAATTRPGRAWHVVLLGDSRYWVR